MNNYIKDLITSFYNEDTNAFFDAVMKFAAQEAKEGNLDSAREIRTILHKLSQNKKKKMITVGKDDFITLVQTEHKMADLIVSNKVEVRINQVIVEYNKRNELANYGLSNRKKILLAGHPGTGKTLTASIIANELSLPFYVISMDSIITKYMGESSVKLRQAFEVINENTAVYLFDEFDAIGAERGNSNDVGEMRRILNTFLQLLEQSDSNSIIIAATNYKRILDLALFRRFHDVIQYELPQKNEIERLLNQRLGYFTHANFDFNILIDKCIGLSHSEIVNACNDSIKHMIINEISNLTIEIVLNAIKNRWDSYKE